MFSLFASVKRRAREIYHRDRAYLWRLFSIVLALYLAKTVVLACCRSLPVLPYKLLDAALSILYIPLGVSVTHMLIHEEHYDHMKADGLFRFYRDPKTMLRCILLVALTTGAVKALLFVVEEALLPHIASEPWKIAAEVLLYVLEEALIAYFFLVQYLFIMHEGHSALEVVSLSCRAMRGDILHHLCFDFSLFVWYLLPLGAWMLLGGGYSLLTTGVFALPPLSLLELSAAPLSILYTAILYLFYFFYTPYVALAKILFAEHAWAEAQELGKARSTKTLPAQRRVS